MSSQERMQSVLLAAVDGSARLLEKRGSAEALHAVERCRKRMARGIDGFRGRIVRTGRDEITAVFETAEEACQAAIAMHRRVADLPPVSGVQLAIRVGFHHGPLLEEGDELAGAGLRIAERLAGLAAAGQILTSGETRALLSSHLQLSTRCLEPQPGAAAGAGLSQQQGLFQVLCAEPQAVASEATAEAIVAAPVLAPTLAPALAPKPAKERSLRLCLRYGGQVKLLDKNRPRVVMGRDSSCEITIRDRRASRNHARIERRGEQFVLRDQSTNGTFVTVSGGPELFLRGEELVLHGSGIIAFAASANSPEADIAEFEHL
ncbi:MAG TPA: adenylate/guanylate cyclase domain-containing protein [Candidatus Accumulibacter sp.]|nr:adenylate/guanylate cyclase domain-containing protein [Accumulibacter sp.]